MMMRMIAAAGVTPLTDSARAPDEDNPLGYFELEAVKKTRQDAAWLADAPGKVVKVVHILLKDLPPTYVYRVVMMHRDLDEVVASQRRMLDRSGRAGATMPAETLKKVFATQLEAARKWTASQPNCSCLDVRYDEVIAGPAGQAARVAEFIGRPERAADMAAAVQESLYRNRKGDSGRSGPPGGT
jgi:hypothetical protein